MIMYSTEGGMDIEAVAENTPELIHTLDVCPSNGLTEKDANEIATELNISLSAVYKTLNQLENLTLIQVEKFTFVDGKKTKFYKSRIGRAEIKLENNDAILHLFPNGDYKESED
mgnify:CR=1 FL=1